MWAKTGIYIWSSASRMHYLYFHADACLIENYHPNARQTPRLEFIYGHLTVPYLHAYVRAGARPANYITFI